MFTINKIEFNIDKKIIEYVSKNKYCTVPEIVKFIDYSPGCVRRKINFLIKKGIIKYIVGVNRGNGTSMSYRYYLKK